MSHKCIACGATFAIPRVDVAVCPSCKTRNPTKHRDEIRDELEVNCAHLAVPSVAAGRAIAYSSAIYRFATHGERMDMGKIESHLAEMHGESAAASRSRLALVSGREYKGLVDERACLSMFVVSGNRAPVAGKAGQPWTYIYVVFRGSRGDAAEHKQNPMGAGWGFTYSSSSVRQDHLLGREALGNLDWRANFDNRQRTPNWAAPPIMVHQGFLEIYSSVQVIVQTELATLMGKHPGAAVIVTGHSLGAAQAVLCAHDLDSRGLCRPFCFPFCTPRVGNMHFAVDFRQRLAMDRGILWGELSNLSFSRAINFVQSNDPVSWGGAKGFKRVMSEKSTKDVADQGGLLAKGLYVARKTKSDTVLFYQTPNVYSVGTGLHRYTKMQHSFLGAALFQ